MWYGKFQSYSWADSQQWCLGHVLPNMYSTQPKHNAEIKAHDIKNKKCRLITFQRMNLDNYDSISIYFRKRKNLEFSSTKIEKTNRSLLSLRYIFIFCSQLEQIITVMSPNFSLLPILKSYKRNIENIISVF